MQNDSDKQIVMVIKWTLYACGAIQEAGGNVVDVLAFFPDDLVTRLIRNNLHLCYIPNTQDSE